ncbi:hypothetical protein JG687_00014197 [Phytophthora cactorum]|uniref:Uncharacterized protein n=1 Tax=Phytophthora cactorum TaxID=29920 RepID=A0A8T1TWS3_9STRA|nr:hypothetical protein JG687_00014197 [Phytophthora cactorum]
MMSGGRASGNAVSFDDLTANTQLIMARIRSSTRTKQAAKVHTVDFRHLWRQLRAVGWDSKTPTRLVRSLRVEPCLQADLQFRVTVVYIYYMNISHLRASSLKRL